MTDAQRAASVLVRAIERRIGEAFLAGGPDGAPMSPVVVDRSGDGIVFQVRR